MRAADRVTGVDEPLPPPSPELILWAVQFDACLSMLEQLGTGQIEPKDCRNAWLKEMESLWDTTEDELSVHRIHSARHDREVWENFVQARNFARRVTNKLLLSRVLRE